MSRFLKYLLILTCISLSSCIEIKEEIWINQDASGKIKVNITGPGVALASNGIPEDLLKQFEDKIKTYQGISLTHSSVSRNAGKTNIELELIFDDSRKLIACLDTFDEEKQLVAKHLIGSLELNLDFPHYTFKRDINYSPLSTGEELPPSAQSLLEGASFTSIIHLPTEVETHNATSLSADKKTLTWQIPLNKLLNENVNMAHTAAIPLPIWVYPSILIGMLILLIAIRKLVRLAKRRNKSITKNS